MLVLCLDVLGTVWVLLGVLWRYCVGTVQGVLLSLSGFCGGSDSCSVGGQYELELPNASARRAPEGFPGYLVPESAEI